MLRPAAISKLMCSGLCLNLPGERAIFSAKQPCPVAPNTASPTLNRLSLFDSFVIIPANSPPGLKGNLGKDWYLPSTINTSGKFRAVALISTSTSSSFDLKPSTFSNDNESIGPKELQITAFTDYLISS